MVRQISESTWKQFRRLREEALRLLCERALSEVQAAADAPERSAHARFLDILKLTSERNEDIARAFDNPRRSAVWYHLLAMYDLDLLVPEVVAGCGPELRELIAEVEDLRSERA